MTMADPPGFDILSGAHPTSAPDPVLTSRPFAEPLDGDDYAERARRKARQEALEALGSSRFTNRELSRLDFGARLLDLAEDERVPLLERVKFMAIFAEMLDEFFQVRVVGAGGPGGGLGDHPLRRRPAARPSSSGPSASASSSWWPARTGSSSTSWCPQLAAGRDPALGLVLARRRRPALSGRRLPPPDVPGAHAARGRPLPPVPLHLEPLAQPGRRGRGPGHRRAPHRPGEGPAGLAPLRRDARRRARGPTGAGDRRPPRHPVPGHDDRPRTTSSG